MDVASSITMLISCARDCAVKVS